MVVYFYRTWNLLQTQKQEEKHNYAVCWCILQLCAKLARYDFVEDAERHSGIESRDHGRNQDICDQVVANMLVATSWSRLATSWWLLALF